MFAVKPSASKNHIRHGKLKPNYWIVHGYVKVVFSANREEEVQTNSGEVVELFPASPNKSVA